VALTGFYWVVRRRQRMAQMSGADSKK